MVKNSVFAALVGISALFTLAACASVADKPAAVPALARSEIVSMIAINDVYRIEGVNDGLSGGLSRVAWLRDHLEGLTGGPVPLMHAGDVLSPSLYSLQGGFSGREMVGVMNMLDGQADAFDPFMFVTVGNHEFDKTYCQRKTGLKPLSDRIAESGFTWLSGNLDYSACTGWDPRAGTGKLEEGAIFTLKGMTFGVFGLTVSFEEGKDAATRKGPEIDPAYIARATVLTAELRAKGAEFVIGLTHLPWACDLKILDDLGAAGPDLIMGGHDHVRMVHTSPHDPGLGQPYRAVYKASSDATDLAVYDFWRGKDGKISYSYSARDMDLTAPTSASVDAAVKRWEVELDKAICKGDTGCLDRVVGKTAYAWELLEHENRAGETRVGNWFTDLMTEQAKNGGSFCKGNAGVAALLNSGTLRLNYDIPANATLADKHVRGVMPYGADLTQLCVPGSMIYAGLRNGLSAPGEGRYPHVANMNVVYKRGTTGEAEIESLTVAGKAVTADSTDRFLLVTGTFLASNSDDGYLFHTLPDSDRMALGADLLTIVPANLDRQTMTPAVTDATRRKVELPGEAPVPGCAG